MSKYLLFILAYAAAFVLTGCENKHNATTPEMPTIPIKASRPVVKDLTIYIDSIGTLQASVALEIRPQVTGQLAQLMVQEGQWVKKGMPLFQIETKPYAIKVQEGEAQLAMDQADYQAAHRKLERFQILASKDLIAQTEWEELNMQVQKLRANVLLSESRLNATKLDLEHCTIISPIDGRVGKLDVHFGTLVSVGQVNPIATIFKMDLLMVEFFVTEKEFPLITHENLPIKLVSLCGSDQCVHGTLTFLDNQFDTKTGLLMIRGQVPNSDYTFRPGQSVKVKLAVSVETNSKLIPQKAIRYNQDGPYVYVVQDDQTIVLRPLILGIEHEKDQVVLLGLDPEELIVIDGHLRLSPGIKVEIKP